jgi:hypothetical protein
VNSRQSAALDVLLIAGKAGTDMSRKPEKQPEAEKKKRQSKKKTKQTLTRAVTHIRLLEANPGKLAARRSCAPAWRRRACPETGSPQRARLPGNA